MSWTPAYGVNDTSRLFKLLRELASTLWAGMCLIKKIYTMARAASEGLQYSCVAGKLFTMSLNHDAAFETSFSHHRSFVTADILQLTKRALSRAASDGKHS